MKFLVILFIFLLPACPFSKAKKSIFKRKQNLNKETTYETPPPAPIPPEQYCYELHGGLNGKDIARLELTITFDSVVGKLSHISPRQDEPDGWLIGTVYGNNMLVSYQYNMQGKTYMEQQEWKISGDSIYRKITEMVKRDSSQTGMNDSVRVSFLPAFYKAPCI